jgi:hypothetical protein
VRLGGLSSRGGELIDLNALDADSAVSRVLELRGRIVSVDGAGISDAVWKRSPSSDSSFVVAGVTKGSTGDLRVVFAGSDGQRSEQKISYGSSDAEDKPYFDGVPYLWASLKIERLEEEYDLNRGEIRRLGKSFGIATRETSLLVLERAEDYVNYDVTPPEELKAEYDRLRIRMTPHSVKKNKAEKILEEWRARDEWWKKDFPKGKPTPEQINSAGSQPDASWSHGNLPGGALSIQGRSDGAPSPAYETLSSPAPAKDSGIESSGPSITVALRPWTPDAPYIRRMKEAGGDDLYRVYLDERPDYEDSAAFYLDVSYQLRDRGQIELSLRVLSNLAEMDLENRQILRVLGYRLLEAEKPSQAVVIFRHVLELADDEPQSFRDLGLAYNAAGEYQPAIDRLYDVVERDFARNFPGIEVIALTEMNAIIGASPDKLDTSRIDPRFLANRPLALRVVLTWDSDNTDIDLHVTDPNGEEVFYGKPLSYQGGRVSPDNTVGYGPEEYSLKAAKPGKYRVDVNFYGHTQQNISEATTIQLDFFTNYAADGVQKQSVTMRLKEAKDRIFVGEFEVK